VGNGREKRGGKVAGCFAGVCGGEGGGGGVGGGGGGGGGGGWGVGLAPRKGLHVFSLGASGVTVLVWRHVFMASH